MTIYSHIKDGKNPKVIASNLGISKQSINYYISQLKRLNIIKKVGYGTWEVCGEYVKQVKKSTPQIGLINTPIATPPNKIRGHAFQFTLRLPKIDNWQNREKFLDKHNIQFKPLKIGGKGQQIIFHGRKVWLTNKSIIIYEKDSYIADSAKEARNYAIDKLMELISQLESLLTISFKIKGNYRFKVSRQHYSRLNCELAKQYRIDGKKLSVYNDKGLWFLIDYSFNIDESETVHPDTSRVDMDNVIAPFFNGLKEMPTTPQQIMSMIAQVTNNQAVFAENLRTHISAVQALAENTQRLGDTVVALKDTIIQKDPIAFLKSNINSISDIFKFENKISLLSLEERKELEEWISERFGGQN